MLSSLIDYLIQIIWDLWYLWIVLGMSLESSIVPLPSEVVLLPAWHLASIWEFNILLLILSSTIWSLIWATFNYFILGRFLWRPFLLKYWKYILIKQKDYDRVEKMFLKNDKLYTFVGRLIPVVRHLISIPAGMFKMRFSIFLLFTALWAALWSSILILLGYFYWEKMIELIHRYTHEISILIVALIIIFVVWFILKRTLLSVKNK